METFYSLRVVGRLYNVTGERIRQIAEKHGIHPGPYGMTLDQVKQLVEIKPVDAAIGTYAQLCAALGIKENR